MKTWDRFLKEVEFLSNALTVKEYVAKDLTREGVAPIGADIRHPVLYMAYGSDNGADSLEESKWLVLFGLFPNVSPHLQYCVRWEPGVCMFAFNQDREERYGLDILSLCEAYHYESNFTKG